MKSIAKYIYVALIFIYNQGLSQSFLNGNFEDNTAPGDLINLTNSDFNAVMPNCTAFGTTENIDIITTSSYSGGPQSGDWFMALTGGGSDQLSLKLSTPLLSGSSYLISFYDKADSTITPAKIEIGASTNNNNFGTLIYTTQSIATSGVWTQRVFLFIPSFNVQYITVSQQGALTSNWVQIDNFSVLCPTIENNSNLSICNGESLLIGQQTIIDTNFISYNWYSNGVLFDSVNPQIQINPTENIIFIEERNMCGETYTDTFFVSVNNHCSTPEPIIIPNVFSPNGDGLNDSWKIELPSSNVLQSVEIIDRWGVRISTTSDLTSAQTDKTKVIQWFGRTASGVACSEGVYYYMLEVKNSKGEVEKYKGYVSLFR